MQRGRSGKAGSIGFVLAAALLSFPGSSGAVLVEEFLTDTSQILPPGGSSTFLGAANLRYSTQSGFASTGNVLGIQFVNVDWLGGAQTLSTGVTLTPSAPGGTERQRFQNTSSTISGTDQAILESIANTLNYLGYNESLTLTFAGLPASTPIRVLLIGGDEGGGLNNWNGDFSVVANGSSVGTWTNVGTDAHNRDAKIASFTTFSGSGGGLSITLTQLLQNQHAGLAGVVITAVPEPSSLLLFGLGGAFAAGYRRRQKRG